MRNPTQRQARQRTLSWTMFIALGAASNCYTLHNTLFHTRPQAASVRAKLQRVIQLLNEIAEEAQEELSLMRSE